MSDVEEGGSLPGWIPVVVGSSFLDSASSDKDNVWWTSPTSFFPPSGQPPSGLQVVWNINEKSQSYYLCLGFVARMSLKGEYVFLYYNVVQNLLAVSKSLGGLGLLQFSLRLCYLLYVLPAYDGYYKLYTTRLLFIQLVYDTGFAYKQALLILVRALTSSCTLYYT